MWGAFHIASISTFGKVYAQIHCDCSSDQGGAFNQWILIQSILLFIAWADIYASMVWMISRGLEQNLKIKLFSFLDFTHSLLGIPST